MDGSLKHFICFLFKSERYSCWCKGAMKRSGLIAGSSFLVIMRRGIIIECRYLAPFLGAKVMEYLIDTFHS